MPKPSIKYASWEKINRKRNCAEWERKKKAAQLKAYL